MNGKSAEEMFEYINTVIANQNHGIGVHSIRDKNKENVLDSILENGIDIEQGKKILSTVSSFGTRNQLKQEHLKQGILQYSYGKQGETKQNVVVLVPTIISNSRGKQVYLGFPPYDIECHGNDYRTSSVLDTLCTNQDGKGNIPPEFILGYYTTDNESVDFVINSKYYNLLSEEDKDEFFEKLEERLQGKYKTISDAVISGDIQTLEQLRREEQDEITRKIKEGIKNNILQRGVNRQLAETLSRNSVQIKQDDSATQALAYVERIKDEQEVLPKRSNSNKRHKILLSYQDVKYSDLRDAKGILQEGLEQGKISEGKEI